MIQVKELYFSYDEKKDVLKDVNISFEKGEVVSILGPNGCGKTTMLKCLNAILKPKRGYVYLNGEDISSMKRNDIARYISYVPQEHKASFPYSVQDFVLFGRSPYIGFFSVPKRHDIEASQDVLSTIGIRHLYEKRYTEISGGERKLALIARAMVSFPQILLLDEPTANLDMRHQHIVIQTIKELAEQKGIMVIMTLHDPNLALLAAKRTILFKEGGVVNDGKTEDIVNEDKLCKLYDCQLSSISDKNRTFIHLKM